MKVITLKSCFDGELIVDIIRKGIETAKSKNCEVHFGTSINGIHVILDPDSEYDVVMRDYKRAQSGYISSTIGPNYEKELDPETIAREEEYANQKAKALEMRFEAEAQLRVAKKLEALILLDFIQAKEMTFLDENAERTYRKLADTNTDDYGLGIVKMANDLARLLEFKLGPNGKITKDMVRECERIIFADDYGASGFQANTAENIVSQCWIRGAEFYPFTVHAKMEKADEKARTRDSAL